MKILPRKLFNILFIFTGCYLIFYFTFSSKCNQAEFLFDTSILPKNISEIDFEYNYDYDKILKHYNLNKSKFFGFPYISSVFHVKHILRSLSDINFSANVANFNAKNVKCGDIIFVKTDHIKLFLEFHHPLIQYPYILMTHESDYAVGYNWQINYLNEKKIIAWFGDNVIASHPKLKPIPIGIVPPENEKFSTIYQLAKTPIPFYERSLLLYTNMSPETNKNRTIILNYFKTKFYNNSKVFIDEFRIPWIAYLQNLGNSQFVLSLPGSGIDCHRTWEAMVMGAVPIVQKSGLQPLYENMPVMIVDEWEEVTEENLKKFKKEKLLNFSKDGIPWRSNIWLRYWIKEIRGLKEFSVCKYC